MTVEKIDEIVAKGKERREALDAEINALLKQEAEIDAAAGAAAAAGDVELYRAKMAEKEDVKTALFVKRSCKDSLGVSVSEEDARSAWSDYADAYNKKLRKALESYKEKKSALCAAYSDMVELQRKACSVREHLGQIVDIPVESFVMDYIPVLSGASTNGLLKIVGFNCGDPDACFYLSDYAVRKNTSLVPVLRREPEEARITAVVVMHKSR